MGEQVAEHVREWSWASFPRRRANGAHCPMCLEWHHVDERGRYRYPCMGRLFRGLVTVGRTKRAER